MTLSISQNATVPQPYANANAIILGDSLTSKRGTYYLVLAINSMYALLRQSLAHAAYSTERLTTAGDTETFECRVFRDDDRTGSDSDELEVWAWVIRSTSYSTSDWQIKTENLENSDSNTAQVNAGATTASGGEWVSLGSMHAYHADSWQTLQVSVTTATNLTSGDGVFAISIIPKYINAYLPSKGGGYSNGFLPINTWDGGRDRPLSTALLRSLHRDLVVQYELMSDVIASVNTPWEQQAGHVLNKYSYLYFRGMLKRNLDSNRIRAAVYCSYDDNHTAVLTISVVSGGVTIGEKNTTITSTGWKYIDFYTSSFTGPWSSNEKAELRVTVTQTISTDLTYFTYFSAFWVEPTY